MDGELSIRTDADEAMLNVRVLTIGVVVAAATAGTVAATFDVRYALAAGALLFGYGQLVGL
jgi:hypothetical protein